MDQLSSNILKCAIELSGTGSATPKTVVSCLAAFLTELMYLKKYPFGLVYVPDNTATIDSLASAQSRRVVYTFRGANNFLLFEEVERFFGMLAADNPYFQNCLEECYAPMELQDGVIELVMHTRNGAHFPDNTMALVTNYIEKITGSPSVEMSSITNYDYASLMNFRVVKNRKFEQLWFMIPYTCSIEDAVRIVNILTINIKNEFNVDSEMERLARQLEGSNI